METVWMQEMTSEAVRDYLEQDNIVIVPIGATESHGPHLPLGTDCYEAIDYAEGIARQTDVLVTPPIWFGDSPHHMAQPGTISLQSETVIAVLKDVYRSLIHHGFKTIITFNGHRWANLPVIGIAAKTVKGEFPGVFFAVMDPLVTGITAAREVQASPGHGVHGGEFETSHMLYKRPALVHMDKAEVAQPEEFPSLLVPNDPFASGDQVLLIHSKEEQAQMAPMGHIGDPTVATWEKGERLYLAIVGNGVGFIEALRRRRKA